MRDHVRSLHSYLPVAARMTDYKRVISRCTSDYKWKSLLVAKNAAHVEPVAEEREPPSDGSRETREITRE